MKLIEVLILAAIVAIVVNVSPACDVAKCSFAADNLERKTKYSWSQGCLVKTEKGWVPLGQLRE